MGLACLNEFRYSEAASAFADAGVRLGRSFADVLVAEDMAVYTALCALACKSRAHLQQVRRGRAPQWR